MNRIITLLIFLSLVLVTYLVVTYSMDYPELMSSKDVYFTDTVWVEYTAPSGRFFVSLPVMPQNAQKKVGNPEREYDMYASQETDGTIYLISLITFSEPITNPDKILQQVPQDLLSKHPESDFQKLEKGTYEGFPSLDFALKTEEQLNQTKTFVDGNTLFVLSRISESSNSKDYQKFIESFQLIRPGVKQ